MGRQAKTRREINEWHRQFGQLKQDWLEWLDTNATHYKTAADAWSAFKAQQQGYKSAPRTKHWFKKQK